MIMIGVLNGFSTYMLAAHPRLVKLSKGKVLVPVSLAETV